MTRVPLWQLCLHLHCVLQQNLPDDSVFCLIVITASSEDMLQLWTLHLYLSFWGSCWGTVLSWRPVSFFISELVRLRLLFFNHIIRWCFVEPTADSDVVCSIFERCCTCVCTYMTSYFLLSRSALCCYSPPCYILFLLCSLAAVWFCFSLAAVLLLSLRWLLCVNCILFAGLRSCFAM